MPDLVVIALSSFSIASAIAVLVSKDNFYSAIYMTLTMILIASIYAYVGIHSIFVLISFIFVGAVGIVTVALAATYRFIRSLKIRDFWIFLTAITAIFLSVTLAALSKATNIFYERFPDFAENYSLLVTFLVVLMVLLALSAINMMRRETL